MPEFHGFQTEHDLPTGDRRELPTSEEMVETARAVLFDYLVTIARAFSQHLTREQIVELMREAVDELEKEE